MAKQEKEFDRSICFSFFEDYCQHVEIVEKEFGIETAYKVIMAIVRYGLYEEEPEDDRMKILVNKTILKSIDLSQNRRARGFKGEDLEKTKIVTDYYRDHPDASQDEIAKNTGVSKGKVNKVIRKIKEEELNNSSTNPNADSYANAVADSNSSMTVTVTGITESHTSDASLDNGAYAPTTTAEQEEKELTYEEKMKIYDSEMIIYKEKEKVWDLYAEYIKPRDMPKLTGFDMKFINSTVDEYTANGNKKPDKPKKPKNMLLIPTIDGNTYEMDLGEFNPDFENNEEAKDLYNIFIDPDGNYKFEPEFTAKWFKDSYGMEVNHD